MILTLLPPARPQYCISRLRSRLKTIAMLFRHLVFLLAISIICYSCRYTSNKDVLLESLQQSLERSALTINNTSQITLAALHEKSMDAPTFYKANIWLPKAKSMEKFTKQLNDDIEKIIAQGPSQNRTMEIKNSLRKKVKVYADSALSIDPLIRQEFGREFSETVHPRYFYPRLWAPLEALDQASGLELAILLTQMKLSVAERGNAVISYCNEQVSKSCGFRIYSVIVGQNSQAIVPGEKLEIVTGVGSFSIAAQPKIHINGRPQPVSEDGTVKYRFTPKGKAGTYHVPVVIDFIDETGLPKTVKKDITFKLLEAPKE